MKLRLWHILLLIPLWFAFGAWQVYELYQWETLGGEHAMPQLTWLAYDLLGKPGVFLVAAFPGVFFLAGLVMFLRDPTRPPIFGSAPARSTPAPPPPKAAAPAATPPPRVEPNRTPPTADGATPAAPVARRGHVPGAPPPPTPSRKG